MRRSCTVGLIAGAVLVGSFRFNGEGTSTGMSPPSLPGASQVIDAGRYPSLQAAFDALPDWGGVVLLPPGRFTLSEPLRLSRGDVLIRGAGTATHLHNADRTGKPALVIEPPQGAKSLWRVCLSDLRITGNPHSGHGIVARRVDEFFLHGVTVSYHGGHGVLLDGCYEDPRISDCLITYNKKAGLALQACHDIVVCGNQFEENLDGLRCIDSFNLCMTGNNLDDHLRHGVVVENTYGSIVSANMIEECRGFAVVLDRDCYGITISANVFAHEEGGGVDLRDAHGCAVSANTFTIISGPSLRAGAQGGLVVVAGNSFSDSTIGPGQVKRERNAATGVVLQGGTHLAVTGNVFSNLSQEALRVIGARDHRCAVSGNVVAGTSAGFEQLTSSVVEGNLVETQKEKKR